MSMVISQVCCTVQPFGSAAAPMGKCQIDLAGGVCRWSTQAELQQLSGSGTGAAGFLCRQWALWQDWQALALQTGLKRLQMCRWLAAELC